MRRGARLRYRPLQAVSIALLATLITACAGFAPLYDRAMQQALTNLAIEEAPVPVSGLQLVGTPLEETNVGDGGRAPLMSSEDLAGQVPAGVLDHYLSPIPGYSAAVTRAPGGRLDPKGPLVWRGGICQHIRIVAGGCPDGAGEIAVSEADVENFRMAIGAKLDVAALPGHDLGVVTPRDATFTVVGVYEQVPGDYWFGTDLTGQSGLADPAPPSTIGHDAWITSEATFASGEIPPLPAQATTLGLVLDTAAVDVDDVLALDSSLADLEDDLAQANEHVSIDVRSGLPDIADRIREETSQSRVTVPLLMAQLGLLAVVVLWLVLLAVTEQRRPEAALARLRGRGRRGARSLLLAELLPAVLIGILPGAAAAVLGAWAARTLMLPGRAPFELGLAYGAAVALAAAVLVLVTVVAVSRVAREPVATLLRRVPARRAGWALGATDTLLIAGAGGIVVVFVAGGLEGPIALAAPGLLAVVVGLVLAHLSMPTAAILGRRLLRRGRPWAGVSALDAARSPATRRTVAIVTLVTALAAFSADAFVVGDRNRASAAEQEAGAPLVALVEGVDLAALHAALETVDPGGRQVTPVVRLRSPGSGAGEVLAVRPDAFRRIALWPGGAPPAADWERLRPPAAEPINLRGTRLKVDVVDSTLRSVRVDGEPTGVTLAVDVVDASGETRHVTLGRLDRPAAKARLAAAVSCRNGCHLTAVRVATLPGASLQGRLTLTNVRADEPIELGPADRWAAYDEPVTGSMLPSGARPDRLSVEVDGTGPTLSISHTWVPGVLPALVAGHLPPGSDGDRFETIGLDGHDRSAQLVGTLARVPASGPATTVINLDAAARGSAIASDAVVELWFASDNAELLAAVRRALAEHDLGLSTARSLTDVRRTYDESAAGWSLQLALLVGGAAVLIALVVLLVGTVSSWRTRSRDLAALRMSGVSQRSIRSLAVAAQLPAVVAGVLAGAAAGVAGAQLALPTVPLFAETPEVSTLDLSVAWGAVVGAGLTSLVVLGAAATLLGRAVARRAEVPRLRETL